MCEPTTIGYGVAALAGGALAAKAMSPKIPSLTPPSVAAPPTPQAPKQPDQASVRRQAQAFAGGLPGGTMLTGAAGIPPSLLNLGRNTLLGS